MNQETQPAAGVFFCGELPRTVENIKQLGVSRTPLLRLGYRIRQIEDGLPAKEGWEEYERDIIDDPHDCYEYARCIIKGRLPEHMHTAMVMHSFSQPDNKWVKKYLGAKKYK